MFVRKVQTTAILLILVVLVKASTAGFVIADNVAKNSADISTEIATDSGYPIHKVSMVISGLLVPIDYLRLHWVDWTQQSKWYEDINTDGHDGTVEYTSPSWAAGYYYEISSSYGKGILDTVLWWDGWVDGTFCNDLHLYTKDVVKYRVNYKWEVVYEQDCRYPL